MFCRPGRLKRPRRSVAGTACRHRYRRGRPNTPGSSSGQRPV